MPEKLIWYISFLSSMSKYSCGVVLCVGLRNTAVLEISQMFLFSKEKITPSEIFIYKLHNKTLKKKNPQN